ncbi:hypothetical protein POSPLADRAFT_1059415 [Postia placenta MAD-698-R-SB12]|uniref:Uncharacterized protein n=1 Tax=Postia placenta MAD-698-R-SB12 TaxID=670580 RepID=A0A1X6MS47_9APHY|nr:hypothetical protein POSPLADRAFT_1059415 [Postia placenta MAD-698-R-SB12]OSX59207.1 hypothetical protein POSPLADRAFT_1059415 [Postia placenta MAD-698-R-SB12]
MYTRRALHRDHIVPTHWCMAASPFYVSDETLNDVGPTYSELLEFITRKADQDKRTLMTLLDAHDLRSFHEDDNLDFHIISCCQALRLGELSYPTRTSGGCMNEQKADLGSSSFTGTLRDKYDYLSTPIRKEYFPKLSPQILKTILTTPPTRVTPNTTLELTSQCIGLDKDIYGSFPKQEVSGPGDDLSPANQGMAQAGCLLREQQSYDDVPLNIFPFGMEVLPLTPPPSGRLPVLDAFPHEDNAEASTQVAIEERTRVTTPPNPLSQAATRGPGDSGPPSAHVPTIFARADLSPPTTYNNNPAYLTATLQHAHGTLSPVALQNFRRVINELQGAGCGRMDNFVRGTSSPRVGNGVRTSGCAPDRAVAPMLVTDVFGILDADSTSCSHMKPDLVPSDHSSPSLSAVRSQTTGVASLDREFAALLADRATEDDILATAFATLASRFERSAKQRRQLALAVTMEGS